MALNPSIVALEQAGCATFWRTERSFAHPLRPWGEDGRREERMDYRKLLAALRSSAC
jgi:hypothetical protein